MKPPRAILAINQTRPTWDLLGHVDDNADLDGEDVGGLPVVGPLDWLLSHDVRHRGHDRKPEELLAQGRDREPAGLAGLTIRHHRSPRRQRSPRRPRLAMGPSSRAACVTTADVTIGSHVAMMPACVLTHDDVDRIIRHDGRRRPPRRNGDHRIRRLRRIPVRSYRGMSGSAMAR